MDNLLVSRFDEEIAKIDDKTFEVLAFKVDWKLCYKSGMAAGYMMAVNDVDKTFRENLKAAIAKAEPKS